MRSTLPVTGLCAALVAIGCGASDTKRRVAPDAATDAGAGGANGTGGNETGGAAAETGGGRSASGGSPGVLDASSDGALDGSVAVDANPPCTGTALKCAGFDGATSSYDPNTRTLTLGLGDGTTPISSGTATFELDCSGPPTTVPAAVSRTALAFDLNVDAGSSFLSTCGPTHLDLEDACGRHVRIDVGLDYNTEGSTLSLICIAPQDSGT